MKTTISLGRSVIALACVALLACFTASAVAQSGSSGAVPALGSGTAQAIPQAIQQVAPQSFGGSGTSQIIPQQSFGGSGTSQIIPQQSFGGSGTSQIIPQQSFDSVVSQPGVSCSSPVGSSSCCGGSTYSAPSYSTPSYSYAPTTSYAPTYYQQPAAFTPRFRSWGFNRGGNCCGCGY